MPPYTGTNLSDSLIGSGGDDTMSGLDGRDKLDGAAGNDSLDGGDGQDTLIGGAGADTINGGGVYNGNTASYETAMSGIYLVTGDSGNWSGDAAGDVLINIQNIIGSAFDDVLSWSYSDYNHQNIHNVLNGGGGNDTLLGLIGDDTLIGGSGADLLDGGADRNMVSYETASSGIYLAFGDGSRWSGDAAADVLLNFQGLSGSNFDDVILWDDKNNDISGLDGNDVLYGVDGNDTLRGGNGNDILIGGADKDVVDGGGGNNTASYETSSSGVYVGYRDNGNWTGDAAGDVLTNISNLTGTGYNDILSWAPFEYTILNGAGGNDRLIGQNWNDTLIGGSGADTLIGGAGKDTASYETAKSGVYLAFGDSGNWTGDAAGDVLIEVENLAGSDFADVLLWDGLANRINGGGGNDTLYGGGGDDTLIGSSGADILDGGADTNTASYETAAAGIYLADGDGSRWTGDAIGDAFINIQNLAGTEYADILRLDAGANIVNGRGGADTLYGEGGDTLIGGGGSDVLIGVAGITTASYATAESGVYVAFGDGSRWTGDAAGDQFVNIQNITGTDYNDTIGGDAGANVIVGGYGNDSLYGGDGDDTLIGSSGSDALDGGAGNNTLSYETAKFQVYVAFGDGSQWNGDAYGDKVFNIQNITGSDYNDILGGDANANILTGGGGSDILLGLGGADTFNYNALSDGLDQIMDFNGAEGDSIGIDSNVFGINMLTPGNNFFSGAGAAPTAAVATLYFDSNSHTLYYDADGTGLASATAMATLGGVSSLSAADFWFHT